MLRFSRIGTATLIDHLQSPLFLSALKILTANAGIATPLQGHGLRIGRTLEYLLRGISFEAVKVIGRWQSDAFLRYLQKHSQILARYLQATPDILQAVVQITGPLSVSPSSYIFGVFDKLAASSDSYHHEVLAHLSPFAAIGHVVRHQCWGHQK